VTDGHRIPQDAGDLVRNLQRRIGALERRGGVSNIKQYLGFGIAPHARRIMNWNDVNIFNNGWYFSDPDALNSPDGTKMWVGQVIATHSGPGIQMVWEHGGVGAPANYIRQFHSHTSTDPPSYTAWTLV
jgi:hypothetical protein